MKPNFDTRFFSQRLYGVSNPYSGFSITVGFPLFGRSYYRNAIKAAENEREFQKLQFQVQKRSINSVYIQRVNNLLKSQELLGFYETEGLDQSNEIIKAADLAYRGGEINITDLIQYLQQAVAIQENYLEVLNQYNQASIQIKYFINKSGCIHRGN